jgi:translation initiation factor 3 subunit J
MFVAGLVKAIAEPLGSEDVKKAASGLTALGNEKLKAEKGPGKKGGKGKKPTLVVGAAKSVAPKFDTNAYDAEDDFDDFMAPSRANQLTNSNFFRGILEPFIWRLC